MTSNLVRVCYATEIPASPPPAPKRFALYLPKEASEAVPGLIPAVELLFYRRFGGLTTYPAVGLYDSERGQIQREEVLVMECYGELDDWAEDGPKLHRLATILAAVLKQETIACSVDGRMHRVKPTPGNKILAATEDPTKLAEHLESFPWEAGKTPPCPWQH